MNEKYTPLGAYITNIKRIHMGIISYHVVLEHLHKKLTHKILRDVIKEPTSKHSKNIIDNITDSILSKFYTHYKKSIKKEDINKIYYNYALVSFITAFETFYRDLFIWLINKKKYKYKEINQNLKLKISTLKNLSIGKMTLGEILSKEYNFQNLDSIQKAYNCIGLDFYKLMDGKENFGNKSTNRIKIIHSLIEKRHRIVHDAAIYNFSFSDLEKVYDIFYGLGIHTVFEWGIRKKIIKK